MDGAAKLMDGLSVGDTEADEEKRLEAAKREERLREKQRMLNENERIKRRFAQRQPDKDMMRTRMDLPAWKEREKIVSTLKNKQVRTF